jgi:hypothetical protein
MPGSHYFFPPLLLIMVKIKILSVAYKRLDGLFPATLSLQHHFLPLQLSHSSFQHLSWASFSPSLWLFAHAVVPEVGHCLQPSEISSDATVSK